MKSFLFSLFLFFTGFIFSQCTHTIKLTDTFGDGWNGGTVSVSVNGVVVLTNITITATQGGLTPINFNFTAATGATIRVYRTAGGTYPSEMRVQVVNNVGSILMATIQPTTGTATSGGITCSASCAVVTPGCTNTSAYGTATAPTTPTTVTISTCNYQSEYSTISGIVGGKTYQFTYSLGGYITVHTGSYNGPIVAYGNSPLNWASSYTGTVYVHYNTNSSCGTASSCGTSSVGCVTCSPPPAPANDLVCNATSITCGQTIAGTTVNATTTGYGELGTCTVTQSNPGVWYKVVGNGQLMTASLCGTVWDSKISIFSGTCSLLSCVGGNDDGGPSCTGTASSYSWSSVNGTTYWILVHGYSTNSTFSISLTCTTPPTPGPCINTTPYGGTTFPTQQQVVSTVSCTYAGEYSTWSTPELNVPYQVSSSNSNDWITVRTTTSNGSVVTYGTTPITFTPNSNTTYYIHINSTNICGTESICRNITLQRISALPIELSEFYGVPNEFYNEIKWVTQSENNSSHYVLELSLDGKKWDVINTQVAAGHSVNNLEYGYIDYNKNEISYYRLQQFDYDGIFETFGPILISKTMNYKKPIEYINILGQKIDLENSTGIIIEVYDDGTIKRNYKVK